MQKAMWKTTSTINQNTIPMMKLMLALAASYFENAVLQQGHGSF